MLMRMMLGDDDIIFSHMHAYTLAWMEVQAYAPFKKIQTAVFIIFEIIIKLATILFLMI